MKKVIGVILLVLAGLAVIGGLANGSLFNVSGRGGAYAAGYIMGQLIGYGALIGGGIALINSSKK